MKKSKVIKDKEFQAYEKRLSQFMQKINPKPSKQEIERMKAEMRKERGM